MSSRGGNNTKKGQAHQNTYSFKHNKNSLLTRKIRETPLDHLCKRCLEKLEWRINYRKYKPLTSAGKCNLCSQKTIYKAYRTICDKCGDANKICTKCCEPIQEYAKPSSRRNDPSFKLKDENPLDEILKGLKERYRRTVERKLDDGMDIVFDEEKGIINEENGEVIVDIKVIRGDYGNVTIRDQDEDEDQDGEGYKMVDKENIKEKKDEIVKIENDAKTNNEITHKENLEEEIIDTFKSHKLSEDAEEGDDSDEDEK